MPSRILTSVFLLVAFTGVAAEHARGMTTSEYLADLRNGRSIVELMLRDATGRVDGVVSMPFDAEKVSEIREALPAEQEVETLHGPQTVSHIWLHSALDEYVTEPDPAKQAAALNGIDERLAAIESAVGDLEKAELSGRTKDENKQKLREILAREQFQRPTDGQQSFWGRWLDTFIGWLERLFPRPSGASPNEGGLPALAKILQWVIIVAVIGLILFIVYRIAPGIFPSLRRKQSGSKEDRVILGEVISADRSSGDLFLEAESLALKGETRAAIRKGYIALLFELADRRQIRLARHKTNRDYLRDVRRELGLFESMRGLTGIFETTWYGSREVGDEAWKRFKSGYEEALSRKQG